MLFIVQLATEVARMRSNMTLVELYLKYGPGVRVKFLHYPEFVIVDYYMPDFQLCIYKIGCFGIQYDGDKERDIEWFVIPDNENKNFERVP